jgi:hypothetical protein
MMVKHAFYGADKAVVRSIKGIVEFVRGMGEVLLTEVLNPGKVLKGGTLGKPFSEAESQSMRKSQAVFSIQSE